MKSLETLTALGNNMLVLWKVTLLIWRSYQIAEDHKSITKLSVNVGYCKRTVREYCGKKKPRWEGGKLLQGSMRQWSSDLPSCSSSCFFHSACDRHPFYLPLPTAPCLHMLQQGWQKEGLLFCVRD